MRVHLGYEHERATDLEERIVTIYAHGVRLQVVSGDIGKPDCLRLSIDPIGEPGAYGLDIRDIMAHSGQVRLVVAARDER